ncbi:MAG: hypothetical protein HY873_14600 [Chloroflexi bacterium]|nr:hypothetical protein [Chloroflexota bacterium]
MNANRTVADSVVKALDGLEKREYESRMRKLGEDRFQWFLFPAILLLLGEAVRPDRRRRTP